MSIHIKTYFVDDGAADLEVGPITVFTPTPWRVLAVYVSGTGTLSFELGDSAHVFKVISGTFTDQTALPSSDYPFPLTIGNAAMICRVTDATNLGIMMVYEDGIG